MAPFFQRVIPPAWRWAGLLTGLVLATIAALAPLTTAGADTQITTCTNSALQAALTSGGIVTFACGTLTIPITTTLTAANNVTIDGGGTITLDGETTTRILNISGPGAVTLKNLTLTRGAGGFFGSGGAVNVAPGATLVVDGATFSRNAAFSGGGISAGIGTTLTVLSGAFVENTAGFGGAVRSRGQQTIAGATFLSNTAVNGGAYYSDAGVVITGSSFISNTAISTVINEGGGGIRVIGAASGLTVTNTTFLSNTAVYRGGGMSADGTTVVVGSTFSSNTAISGSGGGFYADLSAEVAGSTFTGNYGRNGAGFNVFGPATVTVSSFFSNTVHFGGGGFYAFGTAIVSDSTFVSNTSGFGEGGSIFANQIATVTGSTIRGSSALDGGAMYVDDGFIVNSTIADSSASTGGAFYANRISLTNSTVSGNRATSIGGGAAISATTAITLVSSTIADSFSPGGAGADVRVLSGTLLIQNSIVSGAGPAFCAATAIVLAGKNVIPNASCGTGAGLIQQDPSLGPLTDNGGATPTRALLNGSPAIGQSSPCLPTDQRGLPRTAPCDAGAYENGVAPILTSLSPPGGKVLDPAFNLTVNGSGFIPGTIVLWNGSPRSTTVVSPGVLTAAIPASDLAAGGPATVQARYSAALDSTSNSLSFPITSRVYLAAVQSNRSEP